MTENKRYTIHQKGNYHTVIDEEENVPMIMIEFKENEFPVYACFHRIIDLLNEQEELIKRLKTIREEQTGTILKQKRKIKELTTQLQTEEESVCIKCKHHYLTKKDPLHDAISNGEIVPFSSPLIDIEPYYISKCKKEHEECSKEDIRYCEDFKLKGDLE